MASGVGLEKPRSSQRRSAQRAVVVLKPRPSEGDALVEHHKDRECSGVVE